MNANEFKLWLQSEMSEVERSYDNRMHQETDWEYKRHLRDELYAKLDVYDSVIEELSRYAEDDNT
jgi:hypothetical protein